MYVQVAYLLTDEATHTRESAEVLVNLFRVLLLSRARKIVCRRRDSGLRTG